MSEDKNTEKRGGGRYSQRTRRKFYYFKAWFTGLGPKKLTMLAVGAVLVIAIPVGAGVAMNRSAVAAQGAGGSVQLREKKATSLSGSPDAQSALSGESSGEVDVLSLTPPADGGETAPEATPEPTPEPSPTPEPDPSNTVFKYGMEAPVVAEIQSRLMELGYMENDEPTEYYGSITESAVRLFQRQHGLNVDGCVGAETWAAMNADDAQHYTVMEGMDGTDVEELQTRLRELGYIDTVTGHFGEMTTEAVKKFQEINKLTVDGKVGSKTRELLYSPDATANFHRFGEQSDEVKKYQERLKTLGYLTTTPDGNYGNDTVMAVKRFQEINGLIADGFLGPNTINLLNSSDAKANGLQLGMEGSDVTNVQKRLKELGYMDTVTGYYGSLTEDAVKAFQKRNGLSADGKVGKVTMNELMSSSAKKASSSSSSSSGSSSSGSSSSSGGSSSGGSSSSNSSGVEKFISVAESKLGCKYVFGAKGPNTFDCSGFVYWCLNQAGVSQGYMTSSGWASSSKYPKITSMSSLKRGDVVCFDGHVGIYMGNGKMIDASSSTGKVRTTSNILSSSYWTSHFICGFRIF